MKSAIYLLLIFFHQSTMVAFGEPEQSKIESHVKGNLELSIQNIRQSETKIARNNILVICKLVHTFCSRSPFHP